MRSQPSHRAQLRPWWSTWAGVRHATARTWAQPVTMSRSAPTFSLFRRISGECAGGAVCSLRNGMVRGRALVIMLTRCPCILMAAGATSDQCYSWPCPWLSGTCTSPSRSMCRPRSCQSWTRREDFMAGLQLVQRATDRRDVIAQRRDGFASSA